MATYKLFKGWFVVAALVLPGCGGDGRTTVKGTVSLDGKQVDHGSISFIAIDNTDSPNASAAIEAGAFEVPRFRGPKPGKFRVEINVMRKTGREVPSSDPGVMAGEVIEIVPAKYNAQSTLTVDIQPRENTFDFPLTTK